MTHVADNYAEVSSALAPPSRWRALLEMLLIFGVFSLHGAWPVPDVNEAHYLSKAKHYWNPEWCHTDFFVNTADAHQVFYWTFGWLTRLLPLPVVAWVGRLLTWALLAFAWWRLSWAVRPRNWFAVLGAILFVSLNENAHMAGEWIVGGVEAKGFSYVLVLLGIEAVVRARWNRAWILLGAATGMHAIVGGWSLVTAGIAWLGDRGNRPSVKSMLPGLAVGFLLALPGVLFALALTRGVDPQTVADANSIYVWQRLPHHLAADHFQIGFPSRHMLLWALWLVLITISSAQELQHRLRWMVSGAMLLTVIGYGFVLIGHWYPDFAASVLRFYWFRMSDVFVPLGVTLVGLGWLHQMVTNTGSRGDAETRRETTDKSRSGGYGSPLPHPSPLVGEGPGVRGLLAGRLWLAGLVIVAAGDVALQFEHLPPELACCGLPSVTPRADKLVVYDDWRDVCRWAKENTKPDARFLTPRMASTFHWYADRGEVVSWKDIPQNSQAILEWWRRLGEIWGVGTLTGPIDSLALLGPQRLTELAKEYHAEFAIVQLLPNEVRLPLKAVYENNSYAVYRFSAATK